MICSRQLTTNSRTTLLLASALGICAGAAMAQNCKDVTGHFTSQQVLPPSCTSPVGSCTAGQLIGGIQGSFTATATQLLVSADFATTGVLHFTGDIVVTTKDGNLVIKDAGTIDVASGEGHVADVSKIISGTGSLTGATGFLRVQGTFTAAAGGDGDYRGRICTP